VPVNASSTVLRFGVFEVDLRAGELRKQGKRIKIQEQPFHVLTVLLQRPGEVVTREELRNQNGLLWAAHRLCWDDLKITNITSAAIEGTGYDPTNRAQPEMRFAVDLKTGRSLLASPFWREPTVMSAPVDPWKAYRRDRTVLQIMFWGFLPVLFLTAVLADRWAFLVAIGWVTLMLALNGRGVRFRCPLCGKPFFQRYPWRARIHDEPKCDHCGLPKYELPVPDP
jgi:predicted RNA-binding Zn-ribbon protein involved in translation (DUF1610 family)